MSSTKTSRKKGLKEAVVVPLFPLYDHVLLPGIPTPYRVFESRYCSLVQDLLSVSEGDRYLCIPRLMSLQDEQQVKPLFYPVAAIARVTKCAELANGEFQIMVHGLERRILVELPSDRPYRLALSQPLPDKPKASKSRLRRSEEMRHMEELGGALISLASILGSEAEPLLQIASSGASVTETIYRLGSVLIHHPDRRQDFLEERNLLQRIQLVQQIVTGLFGLAAHHTNTGTESLAN